MKIVAPLAALVLAIHPGCSMEVVSEGGFTFTAPDDSELITRAQKPEFPKNGCFPWVRSANFFVDSVVWVWAKPHSTLESEVEAFGSRFPNTTISNVETFRFTPGFQGLRFHFSSSHPDRPPFHSQRVLFRNRENQVVCLQAIGDAAEVSKTLRSIRLTNTVEQ